ncbi:MAG: zinc ribbon domain-containing protein [Clostridia bacterium]|nr:zinc ribbon domain-containing protein [Clostridia bacterium]
MFCSKCGEKINDGSVFCSECGERVITADDTGLEKENAAPTGTVAENTAADGVTDQAGGYSYQGGQEFALPHSQDFAPVIDKPMKWYKFLIYFALWAGGILNILNGWLSYFGANTQDHILNYMSVGARSLFSVLMILLGVFSIYVRYQLAGFKSRGPVLLIASYIVSFVYTAASYLVVLTRYNLKFSTVSGDLLGTAFTTVIYVVCNYVYFKKRKHLFIY